MSVHYERISESWVSQPPNPIGVVEFYGGEGFGLFPTTSYAYFLESLYAAGYAVIAVPVDFGSDHYRIAYRLLVERDQVNAYLPQLRGLPHFWVGHSVGCKFIGLLEALTEGETNTFKLPSGYEDLPPIRGILDEPSLLMAPDISDTSAAIPVPFIANLLNAVGLGIRPTRVQTQQLIENDDLFNLTAIVSFANDTIAGNAAGDPAKSDVAWFIQTLSQRQDGFLLHQEIPGKHMEPSGIECDGSLYRLDLPEIIDREALPRPLEPLVLQFLQELGARRQRGLQSRSGQLLSTGKAAILQPSTVGATTSA